MARRDPAERTLVKVRTHTKALFIPILVAALLIAVAAALMAVFEPGWRPIGTWVVWGVTGALIVWFSVVPFLRWFSTSYTITTRRIITRHGLFNRFGHELPLSRINDVTSERSLTDRLFGCGTLVFTTAAERPVVLHDVPSVGDLEGLLSDVIYREHRAVEPD